MLSVRAPTPRVLNGAPPAEVKAGNRAVTDVLLKVSERVRQPGPRRTLKRIGTDSHAAGETAVDINRLI